MRVATVGLMLMVACQAAPPTDTTVAPPTDTTVAPQTIVTTTVAPSTTLEPNPTSTVAETRNDDPTPEGVMTTLRLSEREARAVSGDVSLVASWETAVLSGSVFFSDAIHEIGVVLPEPTTLTFSYPGSDVVWTQSVEPGSDVIVSQPWRRTGEPAPPGDIALVWLALGDTASYLAQLDAAPGANVASPVCWFVSSDGSLSDRCDGNFVAAAQQRGFRVWPAIAGLDADANHVAFSDPERRSAHAATLSQWAEEIGADGINLDIEGYREEDAAGFLSFVAELVPMVHAWGGVVSYDLIPRTDTWDVDPPELAFWSTAPPRRELVDLVDYTVLMAYDQYNRFRPAGPVAAPGWVEDNLTYVLRYADPEDVILGVPFYGRVWDPDELERPRAVGISTLADLTESASTEFDEIHGLHRATLGDGRYFWVETPEGLLHRLDLVEDHGLAGWAAWRLGFDAPQLWDALGG